MVGVNMKKTLLAMVLSFLSIGVFSQELKIGLLNGPSAIPAAYIIEENDKTDFDFQIFSGADTEIPKLLKGEIDIGVLPPNVAAKIYNQSKGNVVVLAVVGEGNVSLLTTEKKLGNLKSQLAGKTVFCAGRGATPEYMFRYVLEKEKISVTENPKKKNSVRLDFSIPNADLATALISGKVDYILVPEPFATVALNKGADKGVKKITTLSDEYKKVQKTEINFPMTVLVVNKKSLETKKSLVDAYLEMYKKAVQWTNENPDVAGGLVEKHTLGLNSKIATESIPNGAYVFVSGKNSKPQMENLLKIFLQQNPESIGGKIPRDDFYY